MLERLFAAVLLIILTPVILILILVQSFVFHNIIFRQTRIGKDELPFTLLKFTSMHSKMEDEAGLTSKWGRFIRRFSLDEIPQLINILKGDMTFIGPRPLLPEYLDFYTEEQRSRHKLKPGLTGWAQVNGRNNLTWTEQFELDVYYVNNRNLKMNIDILIRTMGKLFQFNSSNEHVIRQPFNGQN